MNQRSSAADSNSKPQVGILGSDRRSAQPPMTGRNTTLITAKQASTTPTLNGVPPSKVMQSEDLPKRFFARACRVPDEARTAKRLQINTKQRWKRDGI